MKITVVEGLLHPHGSHGDNRHDVLEISDSYDTRVEGLHLSKQFNLNSTFKKNILRNLLHLNSFFKVKFHSERFYT